MKFVVYRDSWRRGGTGLNVFEGPTELLNAKSKMCCLGQIGHEAGVRLGALESYLSPPASASCHESEVAKVWESIGLVERVLSRPVDSPWWNGTDMTRKATTINDAETIGDAQREAGLIELFGKSGHELSFEDGIAPWFLEGRDAATPVLA